MSNNNLDGFNGIARYYDMLKRIVFGQSIYDSQIHFLTLIPPDCNVLILGGGSGEILTRLNKINPDSRIWYVEASSEMLSQAAQRLSLASRRNVTFIHGTDESLPDGVVFDVVITHFFLDLFPDDYILQLCTRIRQRLADKGKVLVSDFVDTGKWWQKFLLWVMYRFFVLTCGIRASGLPRWQEQLHLSGLQEMRCATFYSGFIKSAVYIAIEN